MIADMITVTVTNQSIGLAERNIDDVRLYPTPVRDVLIIDADGISLSKVEVYDLTGSLVGSYGGTTERIDVSTLSAGSYVVVITGTDASRVMK